MKTKQQQQQHKLAEYHVERCWTVDCRVIGEVMVDFT